MRGMQGEGSVQGEQDEQELTVSQVLECLLPTVEWRPEEAASPMQQPVGSEHKKEEQKEDEKNTTDTTCTSVSDEAASTTSKSLFSFSIPEQERGVRVIAFLNGQEIKVRITDE